MQLKISRSTGNYLVLNLSGAILTHFADPGPDCQVELHLIDGKEGDDQFRKFLAQAIEDSPMLTDLEDQNAELRQKVAALTERIKQIKGDDLEHDPITELKSHVAAPIAVDVLETNVPRAGRVRTEHIFAGKSRPWLEGFAANRSYRLNLAECEELNSPSIPVEPRNPYNGRDDRTSWDYGWLECLEYAVNTIPDPISYLEQAK